VPIGGAQGSLTITVGVKSEVHVAVTASVTVLAGTVFEPPAFLVDLALPPGTVMVDGKPVVPANIITSALQAQLPGLAQRIQQQLSGQGGLLGGLKDAGKILVGPNLLQVSAAQPMVRFGLWILPYDFPAQELVPATKDFPLPQLTPGAASGCFGMAPLLNPPYPETPSAPADYEIAGFALSVPISTLQLVANIMAPQLAASAGFDVSSTSLQLDASGTVTLTLSGTYDSISVTVKIEEKLGTIRWSILPNFPPPYPYSTKMPGVLSSTAKASVGDLLDWAVAIVGGGIVLGLAAMFGIEKYASDQASGAVSSGLTGLLSSLPPWIPFRSAALSSTLPAYTFPMLVFNFDSFGSTDTAIVGRGTIGLANREQSMVHVSVSGPSVAQSSLGAGFYTFFLMAFEPDDDQMTAVITVEYPATFPGPMTVSIDPFFQQGSFLPKVPPPPNWRGEPYSFTISSKATETCASNPNLTLTGSVTQVISLFTHHPDR
jgi:hypothetical protein